MNVTSSSIQNTRLAQEDRLFVCRASDKHLLAGVFDGHGGSDAALTACDTFPDLFAEALAQTQSPAQAMKLAFAALVKQTETYYCGSTASVIWLDNNQLTVACLGDSPVIVGDASGPIWTSPEHNVRSNPSEAAAARARGGAIVTGYLFDPNSDPFTQSGLQMSRAIGDVLLDRVLDRTPEIFEFTLGPDSWVLLCTDGLIDPAHTNNKAVASIATQIAQGLTAAQLVTQQSLTDNHDNSTAILLRMD